MQTDTHTIVVGFTNAGAKAHANARCGMSRTNRAHNTPSLFFWADVQEAACGRCGGPEQEATPEVIKEMWEQAYRQSRRSPYGGMPQEYCTEQAQAMIERLAEMVAQRGRLAQEAQEDETKARMAEAFTQAHESMAAREAKLAAAGFTVSVGSECYTTEQGKTRAMALAASGYLRNLAEADSQATWAKEATTEQALAWAAEYARDNWTEYLNHLDVASAWDFDTEEVSA